ncbi:MAG: O-antigen/teichoic acid export membrane protein [Saprospiraceae bacterium]|jgi:O-antigen/teichoic acid export membrane protein
MKKKFLINFFLLFFVNILVKPAWLLADLMVQRETGEEYGQYFILFNLSVMLNMFLDFGISNYNNRKVAGNEQNFKSYFSKVFTLRMALAAVYFVALIGAGFFLSYDSVQLKMLLFLGVNQTLLATLTYFRSNLTALGHFKFDSLISVVDRIIMAAIILSVVFFSSTQVSIVMFIKIQFVGYLATVVLAFLLLAIKGGLVKLTWNFKFNKTLLQKSYPYSLIVVLMSIYSYSDSLMLDQMLENGIWENTIYAQSFRILMAVNSYIYLVAVLLLPMFAKMIKNKAKVAPLLRLSGSMLIFGTLVLTIIFNVFSYEIINGLYAHYSVDIPILERLTSSPNNVTNISDVQYSANVFSYLVIGIVSMSFNFIYGVLLTAGGKMKILNGIALLGIGANLLLNWFLIPVYGALGAAVASVITQTISALCQWFYCYREHEISFPYLHFIKFVAIGLLLYNASVYFKQLFEIPTAIALIFILSFGLIFTLRIVTWKAVKDHLLKK